eukprot:scaffold57080_cov33-Attheya_sp.AAC.1
MTEPYGTAWSSGPGLPGWLNMENSMGGTLVCCAGATNGSEEAVIGSAETNHDMLLSQGRLITYR